VGLVWRQAGSLFTKYISLAFEAGFDHTGGFVPTQNGYAQLHGWVRKFTIAPQIGKQVESISAVRYFAPF